MATSEVDGKTLAQLASRGNLKELKAQLLEANCANTIKAMVFGCQDNLSHLAARNGHRHVLEFLRDEFDMNYVESTNADGKTALHEAAQHGKHLCVEALIKWGSRVDALKRADWTPLMLACAKGDSRVVLALLDAGANPRLRNKDGWTSFHVASRARDVNVLHHLLERDVQLWRTTSNNGRTPLHTAALHGNRDIVEYLLANCFYLAEETDQCGSTAFMDSLRSNHVDVAQLIAHRHDVDFRRADVNGRQAIHLAAEAGALDSLKYLIERNGVDVNEKTKNGHTALHIACRENQCESIRYLMDKGADPFSVDNKGRKAVDFCPLVHRSRLLCLLFPSNLPTMANS